MSLKVWLPLNGNLRNNGISDATITNNGATVETSGKLGPCYYFNGNSYLSLPSYSDILSICFWIKATKTSAVAVAFADYKSKLAFGWNANQQLIVSCVDKSIQMYASTNFPDNTWVHVAIVYNTNKSDILLYLNGVLQTSRLTTNYFTHTQDNLLIGRRTATSPSYMTCYINDFRVYNHRLSLKEIKEIARGLVVHYKLDATAAMDNIIPDASGMGNYGIKTGTVTYYDDTPRYSKCGYMNNKSTANRIESVNNIVLPTDGISASFWINTKKSNAQVIFATSQLEYATNANGSYAWISPQSAGGFSVSTFKNDQWNHIVATRAGSTFSLYINGVKIKQSNTNNNWTHNKQTLYLFNRSYNNSYAAIAYMSDFRLYATALTQADVLELYKIGLSLDKEKGVHTFEFDEQNNSISLTNKGTLKAKEIEEENSLAFYKTGDVKGLNLIEI